MGVLDVRRAADGFLTSGDGLRTRHAFSFGEHFDPHNTGFGWLVAHNDERLDPGAGYNRHRHAGLDIVTWVSRGELTHVDSTGRRAVTSAGRLQHLRAGTGVEHSERNEGGEALRFVQMWLVGDADAEPAYAQHDERVLRLGAHATLEVLGAAAGTRFRLPEAHRVHLSVAHGSLDLDDGVRVRTGDTVRVTGGGGTMTAAEDSEVLVWKMEER